MRRGWWWFLLAVVVAAVVYLFARDGDWLFAGGYGLVMLALLLWSFPWRGGRAPIDHASVQKRSADDPARAVVVYWRPGCLYCSALRRRLGRSRTAATWINIWTDEQAAAYVRSVNGGNETVPTVVIDGVAHTNPSADSVREALSARS